MHFVPIDERPTGTIYRFRGRKILKFTHLAGQELETRQQRAVHGLREGQLTKQHQTELGNQVQQQQQQYSFWLGISE